MQDGPARSLWSGGQVDVLEVICRCGARPESLRPMTDTCAVRQTPRALQHVPSTSSTTRAINILVFYNLEALGVEFDNLRGEGTAMLCSALRGSDQLWDQLDQRHRSLGTWRVDPRCELLGLSY